MGALTQGILEPKILRCKVHRFTSSIPKFITKNFITRQGQNQHKNTRFFNLVTFAHIGNFLDKRFGSLSKAPAIHHLLNYPILLIKLQISEIQSQIYTHHGKVQNIEKQNIPVLIKGCHICLICEFRCNTCYVAKQNENQKRKALPLSSSRLIRFHYIHRPRCAEAE